MLSEKLSPGEWQKFKATAGAFLCGVFLLCKTVAAALFQPLNFYNKASEIVDILYPTCKTICLSQFIEPFFVYNYL